MKHYIYESNDKPDIICIQESWLKNTVNFKLNNYSIVRKDRKFERGGGVCVFIKNSITYKIIENEFVKNVEYNHIEFILNNRKLNLINIYNPGGKLIDWNMIFFLQLKMLLYVVISIQKIKYGEVI